MRAGLPISLLLHGGVMFGALALSGNVQPLAEGRVIPIDLITIAPETNIKAAIRPPKPKPIKKEQPELKLKKPAKAAPEIAPEVKEVAKEKPKAKPKPKILKAPPEETPEKTPEPVKTAEAVLPDPIADKVIVDPNTPEPVVGETIAEPVVPDVQPVAEPEPEEPSFSLDSLSGLIDKSRETAPDKNTQVALQSETNQYAFADHSRAGTGEGNAMTLSELDALQSAMYKCWRIPADAIDPEKLLVRLEVKLLRGGLVEDVRVIDKAKSRRNSPGNPFWDVAEQRAVRAVAQCAPYDFLPDEKFGDWRKLILNFRPQL